MKKTLMIIFTAFAMMGAVSPADALDVYFSTDRPAHRHHRRDYRKWRRHHDYESYWRIPHRYRDYRCSERAYYYDRDDYGYEVIHLY